MHSTVQKIATVSTIAFACGANAALYNTTISTQYGLVQGVPAFNSTSGPSSNLSNWEDITVWKGIPFAASTAGANRWKAPQPPSSWNGTLLADSFGPICPQGETITGFNESEDCLSVNIWTASNSTSENLPVMVWNYGAGTTAAQSKYDGGGMASKGVIFVSYNYRTGPWGWLSLPELTEESTTNSSGNYGLLDQIEILKWVKANIADFGGDPDSITNVGQSFGSAGVFHTINSPLAKGLIKGAICESGIKDPYDPTMSGFANSYMNQTESYAFSEIYAESLNVTTVAELRDLSIDVLATGTGVSAFSGFQPTLDGYAIPYTYFESLLRGPVNDVPIIAGNNKDEDGASTTTNVTYAEYIADTNTTYGKYADDFLSLYIATNDSTADTATNARARDIARVSTWLYANSYARTATSDMYVYYWDHAPPGQTDGAFHASEIPYVLNNLYGTDYPWESLDYSISDVLSSYWVNFIKSGNPNTGGSYAGGNLTQWNPSSNTSETAFHLGSSYGMVPLASEEQVQTIFDWFQYAQPDPW